MEKNGTFASPATARASSVLPVPGRSDQQNALGDAAAQALELLRLAQELDDLLQFFLGLVNAGHVLEGDLLLLHREQAGAGFAEAHGLVAAGLHLAQQEEPQAKQKCEGRDVDQRGEPGVGVRVLDGDGNAVVVQNLVHVRVVGRNGGAELVFVGVVANQRRTVNGDVGHLALVCLGQQVAEGDSRLMHGAHIFADKGPQADDARDQEDPDNKLFDGRVQSRFLILPA